MCGQTLKGGAPGGYCRSSQGQRRTGRGDELKPSRAAATRRSSACSSLLHFEAAVQDAQVRAAIMGVRTDLNRRAYIHFAQPTSVASDSLLTAGATRAFSVCS